MLVLVDEDRDLRVAHALAADAGVGRLAILGSPRSNSLEKVDDPNGFDVIVGRTTKAIEVAARVGGAAVTAADLETSPVPTVSGASLLGCGLAMASAMEQNGADILRVSIAKPGGPDGGSVVVHFPPPVGRLRGKASPDYPFQVVVAGTKDPWGTLLVESNLGDQAVVDDYAFLAPLCLAAAVSLVPPAGVIQVWDAPGTYLAKAESMGLVAATKTVS